MGAYLVEAVPLTLGPGVRRDDDGLESIEGSMRWHRWRTGEGIQLHYLHPQTNDRSPPLKTGRGMGA
jgi:hypothetical protein